MLTIQHVVLHARRQRNDLGDHILGRAELAQRRAQVVDDGVEVHLVEAHLLDKFLVRGAHRAPAIRRQSAERKLEEALLTRRLSFPVFFFVCSVDQKGQDVTDTKRTTTQQPNPQDKKENIHVRVRKERAQERIAQDTHIEQILRKR